MGSRHCGGDWGSFGVFRVSPAWISITSGEFSMKKLMGFIKKDDGLVAIEWVGIAAVMLVAAIAIAGAVMQGVFTAGETLGNATETMADEADAPAMPVFTPTP